MLISVKRFREELGPDENGHYIDLETLRELIEAGAFPFAVSTKNPYKRRFVIIQEAFEAWKINGGQAPSAQVARYLDFMNGA